MNTKIFLTFFFLLFLLSCKKETPVETKIPPDVELDPPPAGQGVQIGIPPFSIPQGAEIQRDYYVTLPSDSDIYVNKIEFRYSEGSHHCNVFKSDSLYRVSGTYDDTFTAVDFSVWDMFCSSQSDSFPWQMPAGVAIRLKAHQQICIQSHYVNANTQSTPNSKGKVLVNLWTIPGSSVTSRVGLFFASNLLINIPPHDSLQTNKYVTTLDWDIHILTLTGHFHSRGKNFWVERLFLSSAPEEIYRNQTWDEPPMKIFSEEGYSLPQFGQIVYHSTYYNATSDTIHFGPHVENEEHSNLFMTFYPAPPDGKTIYDIDKGW